MTDLAIANFITVYFIFVYYWLMQLHVWVEIFLWVIMHKATSYKPGSIESPGCEYPAEVTGVKGPEMLCLLVT